MNEGNFGDRCLLDKIDCTIAHMQHIHLSFFFRDTPFWETYTSRIGDWNFLARLTGDKPIQRLQSRRE